MVIIQWALIVFLFGAACALGWLVWRYEARLEITAQELQAQRRGHITDLGTAKQQLSFITDYTKQVIGDLQGTGSHLQITADKLEAAGRHSVAEMDRRVSAQVHSLEEANQRGQAVATAVVEAVQLLAEESLAREEARLAAVGSSEEADAQL